ncbi:MAG: hypothetical protein WKF79_16540 [Nocardioides sp.]
MSTFETFGPSHLVMLVICLAAIPLVVRMGRAQRGTVAVRRTSRIFAGSSQSGV